MSLTYLKGNLHLFSKAYLIDNSEETANVKAEIEKGILINKQNDCPKWVNDSLFIIERLSKR